MSQITGKPEVHSSATRTTGEISERQLETLMTGKRATLSKTIRAAVPRQKSVYDHVEIDFVKSGKKTFLFRLLVAGIHEDDPTELMKSTRMMIDEINAACQDELATGFFLAYPRQFIHVLEGSEDTLNQYLARCANLYEKSAEAEGSQKKPTYTSSSESSDPTLKPPRVKMLVLGYFAIQDRLLPRWLSTKFNPPRDLQQIKGGFRNNLFELVRTTLILAIIMSKQPIMKNGEVDWPDQSEGPKTKERREQDMQLMQYLPSQNVIMFILHHKSKNLKLNTPKDFIRAYWEVPDLILTSETTWPIPSRLAPYN